MIPPVIKASITKVNRKKGKNMDITPQYEGLRGAKGKEQLKLG